jgi:hypothetical protein
MLLGVCEISNRYVFGFEKALVIYDNKFKKFSMYDTVHNISGLLLKFDKSRVLIG